MEYLKVSSKRSLSFLMTKTEYEMLILVKYLNRIGNGVQGYLKIFMCICRTVAIPPTNITRKSR